MSFDESKEDIQCKISKQLRGRIWQRQLVTSPVVVSDTYYRGTREETN